MSVTWIPVHRRRAIRHALGLLVLSFGFGSVESSAQGVPWDRLSYRSRISDEKRTAAKKFSELMKKARKENPGKAILSKNDIHGVYAQGAPRALSARMARQMRASVLPRHRPSVVSSPASLLGPLSLGPAYGVLMFQNSINLWPDWQGGSLPWNGTVGSRYLLSSGPLTIPYELALQNRVQMTTVTDAYGNQLVLLTDISTGFSQQFAIIGRLDSVHAPGTGNPVYGAGYVISVYDGRILGTNSSSIPGVFVPAPPFQPTFGYMGDLDTLGPFGRGNTPLNPPGPPTTYVPGGNPVDIVPTTTFP
ncbi:hypothetical protein GC170_04370 [bacterium]|nr:hypothetical protein [bacterium]